MKRSILIFPLLCMAIAGKSQQISPLWTDFVTAKQHGETPVLPDFSYAGYHWSEKTLPSLAGKKVFKVADYGAIPNDELFDDASIQKAVDAAEANPAGGIVFFEPGKYLIAPDGDAKKQIRISKSGIILKGSGSGAGGTEIYQANMRINGRQFLFKPEDGSTTKLTTIVADAGRETFAVNVQDASKLKVGQDVVIRHRL